MYYHSSISLTSLSNVRRGEYEIANISAIHIIIILLSSPGEAFTRWKGVRKRVKYRERCTIV
jgi:hypothetical protein